jgi:beta-lactamase regulating signal transducer with metallopeptidase domain
MHLDALLATERSALVVSMLGAALVKGTTIFLLGAVCSLLARGTSAATRHLIWTLTLAGALVAPAVGPFVPHWIVPFAEGLRAGVDQSVTIDAVTASSLRTEASSNAVLAGAAWEPASRDGATARNADVVSTGEQPSAALGVTVPPSEPLVHGISRVAVASDRLAAADLASPPRVAAAANVRAARARWLFLAWALGAIVAVAPGLAGLLRLSLVARCARSMRGGPWALLVPSVMRELDVRRRVRFIEADGPVMPMTWGVVRPIVLVPADDFGSTIEQRLDVLRHELAHVRRFDCLTQLVAQLACAVHWFNPLAWIAAREMRAERERACDDEVLRAGARASEYADYLLRVARSTRMIGAAALGGLAMARPSRMAGRLLAVLDEGRRRGRVSTAVGACVVGVATAFVAGVASASTIAARPTPADLTSTRDRWTERREPAALPSADAVPSVARDGTPVLAAAAGTRQPRAARAHVATSAQPCEPAARGSGKGSHTDWTSSDNGAKRWRVMWSEGDCSYEIDARGEIRYNRDVTDIESISSGGQFSIEQHVGDDTKRLVVRPRADGSLERSYSVDGAVHEYDTAARAWFAEALVALDRQTAFAADQRVPAIVERGGVDAVLQEISLLGTDYARRRYYTKLLAMRQLNPSQVERVVERAGTDMTSDYELAELLIDVSKRYAMNDQTRPAYIKALGSIKSDYEHRRVLAAIVAGGSLTPAVSRTLLEDAMRIHSDYELAEFLIQMAKAGTLDASTRDAYFAAANKIGSDYEHHRALSPLLTRDLLAKDMAKAILASAAKIDSDYECASLLVEVANAILIDEELRPAFEKAADTIQGEYEYGRAMGAVRRRVTR